MDRYPTNSQKVVLLTGMIRALRRKPTLFAGSGRALGFNSNAGTYVEPALTEIFEGMTEPTYRAREITCTLQGNCAVKPGV